MPLTGIAAVGAFAPVIAMTSCGNKANKLIESYEFTNHGGLIGANDVTSANTFTLNLKGTLANVPVGTHTFKRTVKAQESDTKIISVTAVPEETVTPTTWNEKEFTHTGAFTLKITNDAEVITSFLQGQKDDTFTWEVEYEEFDGAETPKSVGKWTEKYSVTVFHKKVSLPTFSKGTSWGTTAAASATSFNLEGWTFGANLANDDKAVVSVSFKDKKDVEVQQTSQGPRSLKLTGTQKVTVAKNTKAINFEAKLVGEALPAAGTVTFTPTKTTITLEIDNGTNGYYVLDKWEEKVEVETTDVITITIA